MDLDNIISNSDVLDKLEILAFNKVMIKKIGMKSGVYFLFDSSKSLLYIGKSIDLKQRLRQHIHLSQPTTKEFIKIVKWFAYIDHGMVPCNLSIGQYELKLIKKYKPKMNRETLLYNMFKDWK